MQLFAIDWLRSGTSRMLYELTHLLGFHKRGIASKHGILRTRPSGNPGFLFCFFGWATIIVSLAFHPSVCCAQFAVEKRRVG